MQLQPVGPSIFANSNLFASTYDKPTQSLTDNGQKGLRSGSSSMSLNATIEAEYLSVDKYSMQFTSKDGDTVSVSMESVQYQKSLLQVDATGNSEDIQKILDYIKKEYEDMRTQILKEFFKKINGKADEMEDVDKTSELAIPEYWNAENTSQRIVDFALQFYDAFEGAGEDFLAMIKGAIENGFAEAKEMLGDLPDPISQLVSDTHDLVMQKLDKWAEEKGIMNATQDQNESIAEPATAGA
jgi:gas vesicle protein